MNELLNRTSRRMSSVLRHRAGELGLDMSTAGWVEIDALAQHLAVSRGLIEEVVEHNNKARFEIRGSQIRASQGHSLAGMPVTQEALEASWTLFGDDTSLWHGTRTDAIESIASEGLRRGDRSHVHLARARDSQVGKRSNVSVLLEVSSAALREAGQAIYKSPNGVILCRHVPAKCIVSVHPLSKRARQSAASLRAAFGLPR